MVSRLRLGPIALLCSLVGSVVTAAPTPGTPPTPLAPSPSPTVTASPAAGATATRIATARPSPSATGAVPTPEPAFAPEAPAAPLTVVPAATAVLAPPRTYRTPESSGPRPFVAPPAGAPAGAATRDDGTAPVAPAIGGGRPPARATGSLVVFRVTARTALEGFDLRVGYPRVVGSFGTGTRPAECTTGTGMLVAANDRGDGELRLLVASAQPLPFPLDVFCRFAAEPGAGIAAGDLGVRVAEVTSGGTRADPSLLLVSVVVR